jgi:glycosyltransferase involved in cell wall biosynthesis
MPILSVVIPVYNGQRYLTECLNSVFAQSFTDYEVICIDDGSTDESSEIVEFYAKRYPNLRLVKQSNMGVSEARNRGVFEACGKYIHFLDQDDLIKPVMYEVMVGELEKNNYDFVCCDIEFFGKSKSQIIFQPVEGDVEMSAGTAAHRDYLRSFFLESNGQGAVWNKVFARDFILSNLRFISRGLIKSEDTTFSYTAVLKLSMIKFIHQPLYEYRVRNNSQSRVGKIDDVLLTVRMLEHLDEMSRFTQCADQIIITTYNRYLIYGLYKKSLTQNGLSLRQRNFLSSSLFHSRLFDLRGFLSGSCRSYILLLMRVSCMDTLIFHFLPFNKKLDPHLLMIDSYE